MRFECGKFSLLNTNDICFRNKIIQSVVNKILANGG